MGIPFVRHRSFVVLCFAGFLSSGVAAEPLRAVVEKALTTNPEVLTASANMKATEQELEQARAGYRPTIDVRGGGGREWSRNSGTSSDGRTLSRSEKSIALRQLIYDGGFVSAETAKQLERLRAAEKRLFDVSSSIGQRISDVYIEVLKNEVLYSLAKENLKVHEDYLGKMGDRVKKGVGQRADLQLADGRMALAASTLTSREAALDDAKIRYKRLVGEAARDLSMPEPVNRAIPAILELATEISFANHPSLAAARADVDAARQAEASARTKLMPTVSLEVGATGNKNIDGTHGNNYDRTAMVVMNYNLFRGGADDAKIKETGERLTAAMETQNNVQRAIEEEVGRAWVALNAAKASLHHLEEHAKRTEEVKGAYQAQFEIGRRTMLDLMNAENELFQAKSSLTSGRYAVIQGEYRLLAAMGGLLKVLSPEKY